MKKPPQDQILNTYIEHISGPPKYQAPCIGLTGNFDGNNAMLAKAYFEAVTKAGGSPLIIPPLTGKEKLESILDRLDGLIFTGGGDFNPILLGEEPHRALGSINTFRDEFELLFVRLALDKQLPILGICRGIQVLNLGMGGTLYQDIYSQHSQTCLKHDQTAEKAYASHFVDLKPDTLLRSLFNKDNLAVNSFHHQAIRELATGLKVSALSSDNIIEAVESNCTKPIIGVQWHPECLIDSSNDSMLALFEWLVKEALLYRECRTICRDTITVDTHCDTALYFTNEQEIDPVLYSPNFDFYSGISARLSSETGFQNIPENKVDLRKMQNGGLNCSVMAAYLKQGPRDHKDLENANRVCLSMLSSIKTQISNYPELAGLARCPQDIRKLKSEGKIAILPAIENAYALGNKIENLDAFEQAGVCYITLCHNGHNEVCDSASEQKNPEHKGLSNFGKEVVRTMNQKGILIDLSHASEKSFYDVLELSQAPVIASHSSARALCDHPRNLSDEQILALSRHQGYMGICLYEGFLAKNRPAGIRDAVAHINHVRALAGIEILGIGSDFDGGGGIPGCNNAQEYFNLLRTLMAEGYTREEIRLITGGNFIRTMEAAHQVAAFLKRIQS